MIALWPCPSAEGTAEEFALAFDRAGPLRLLVVPALFDEGNRLRRFTAQAMRALAALGVDSFLPDLPGTGESLQPLSRQSLGHWRAAMEAAAAHFAATHVLAIRGGGLVAPSLPGLAHAPVSGGAILRQLLRARVLAAREAGREEKSETLLALGLAEGLELAGYPLGPAMIAGLQTAEPANLPAIVRADLGGPALWLRAEAGEDPAQSAALARRVARAMGVAEAIGA